MLKKAKIKRGSANKTVAEIIIPAINPAADIAGLFGAWKNSRISMLSVRKSAGKTGRNKW